MNSYPSVARWVAHLKNRLNDYLSVYYCLYKEIFANKTELISFSFIDFASSLILAQGYLYRLSVNNSSFAVLGQGKVMNRVMIHEIIDIKILLELSKSSQFSRILTFTMTDFHKKKQLLLDSLLNLNKNEMILRTRVYSKII